MIINVGWNIETYITISSIIVSLIGVLWIARHHWKAYGLLFLLSAFVGNLLCYLFVKTGLYSYPYNITPWLSVMPVFLILTMFPFLVLLGVRYSPKPWIWKIPFYWLIVHIGMMFETWAQNETQIIRYDQHWDFWDSYTWWWIFFLVFEWLGGIIVPAEARKPIEAQVLRYPSLGWFLFHLVFIGTVFVGGLYMCGKVTFR
jgi:hypothetical protein